MKDLGIVKRIPGMDIKRDRSRGYLYLIKKNTWREYKSVLACKMLNLLVTTYFSFQIVSCIISVVI